MAKVKGTQSPWGNEPASIIEMGELAMFVPVIQAVSKAYDELEIASRMIQLKLKKIPRFDEVLDLFPETLRRIEHIKADLEDIQANRPYRHG